MAPPIFHVREIGLSPADSPFFLNVFDSTLPYLASIGSGDMWGLQPFSERGNFTEETLEQIEQSRGLRPTPTGEVLRILIAETELAAEGEPLPEGAHVRTDGDKRFILTGALMLRENWVPSYVKRQEHLGLGAESSITESTDFVYIEVMIADFRASKYRQGAGAALLLGAKDYAIANGKKIIFVDSWNGNGGKLTRYYEAQGYQRVGDFSHARKDKPDWLGTLLRMDIVDE
ncbi:acetyltransferase [Thozetella sp. PMI_491]|nr:acetyltransferase [Thozetella sp. PMI_491]